MELIKEESFDLKADSCVKLGIYFLFNTLSHKNMSTLPFIFLCFVSTNKNNPIFRAKKKSYCFYPTYTVIHNSSRKWLRDEVLFPYFFIRIKRNLIEVLFLVCDYISLRKYVKRNLNALSHLLSHKIIRYSTWPVPPPPNVKGPNMWKPPEKTTTLDITWEIL